MDQLYEAEMSYQVEYICLCTDKHCRMVWANSDKLDIDLFDTVVPGDDLLARKYLPYWLDFSNTVVSGHLVTEVNSL